MKVPTPISTELKRFALNLVGPVPDDALKLVQGQEHLLTQAGFIADVACLVDLPSLSPETGRLLDKVVDSIDEALASLDPVLAAHVAGPLKEYRAALALLTQVCAFQSGFLVAYLKQEVLDRPLAMALGVGLEQLDMTVKLLKMGRKNSDGSPWETGEAWR